MGGSDNKKRPGGRGWRWRWAAGLLVVLAVAVAAYQLPVLAKIVALQGWLRGHGVLGCVLYAVGFTIGVVLLLPPSILSVGGGFVFGFFWGSVIVWIGTVAGATVAFLIGRHGPRARIEWLARRHPWWAGDR